MTSSQLYFAVGVPILAPLIGWIASALISRHAINDLRSEMGVGFSAVRSEMTTGFVAVNAQIDDLRADTAAGFAAVNQHFERIEVRLDRIEARFDRVEDEIRRNHENRLVRLEARVFPQTA